MEGEGGPTSNRTQMEALEVSCEKIRRDIEVSQLPYNASSVRSWAIGHQASRDHLDPVARRHQPKGEEEDRMIVTSRCSTDGVREIETTLGLSE